MAKVNPSPAAPGVVADPAKDSWTLVLLKAAWPLLVAVLVLVSAVVAVGMPDRMAAWGVALPLLSGMVIAMGAAAFGGPAVKRAQEIRSDEGK